MVYLTPAPLERQPVPARKRRCGCIGGCPWDCDDVSAHEREEIYQSFWGHQREQTEEVIQSCQHEECRFHRHRCVSEGACHNSASCNRQATAQPPEKVMLLSHKERKFEIEVKYSHGPLQPPSYVSCEMQRLRKGRKSTSAGLASAECHRSMNLMLDATSARPSTMNYKKSFFASFHLISTLNTRSCLLTRQQTDRLTCSSSSIFFLLLSRN